MHKNSGSQPLQTTAPSLSQPLVRHPLYHRPILTDNISIIDFRNIPFLEAIRGGNRISFCEKIAPVRVSMCEEQGGTMASIYRQKYLFRRTYDGIQPFGNRAGVHYL